jgi:hypothetical protein
MTPASLNAAFELPSRDVGLGTSEAQPYPRPLEALQHDSQNDVAEPRQAFGQPVNLLYSQRNSAHSQNSQEVALAGGGWMALT